MWDTWILASCCGFGLSPGSHNANGVIEMKHAPWFIIALSPFVALGLTGAMPAQFAVLLVVFGIFFATLRLNPHAHSKTNSAYGDAE